MLKKLPGITPITQEKKLKNWYIQEYTTEPRLNQIFRKTSNEEVQMTMVNINNKVLNNYSIDMII